MAMTLRLTDEESEALRLQAEVERRSQHDVVRAAVREYVSRRAHMAEVREALEVLTPRYRELLDRLAQS